MGRSRSDGNTASSGNSTYRGRFAPSPTGPLHAGSLVAALASWLDARAHAGTWLVRIEDLDPPREMPGAATQILDDLSRLGLESDEPVMHQSDRNAAYEAAFDRLREHGHLFPCICSRSDIRNATHAPSGTTEAAYPGTCRHRKAPEGRLRSWRFRVDAGAIEFFDRCAGSYQQDVAQAVGDFVIRRADGKWAYQLAVVVDDADQGVTDVVRGSDLIDNTPRQVLLQHALGLSSPRYCHVPVVVGADGRKLSKQTGAQALDRTRPLNELERAAAHLQLPPIGATTIESFLRSAIEVWKERVVARQGP